MLQKTVFNFARTNGIIRASVYKGGQKVINRFYPKIATALKRGDKVLDIGPGTCHFTERIQMDGYEVTPLDIQNISFVDGINPLIYDGKKIPFKNRAFDVALLTYVLHHVPNPHALLKETKRVANKIIIFEDIYGSVFQKYLTFGLDSLFNVEFIDHPHSNQNDVQWKNTFKSLGLKLNRAEYWRHLGVLFNAAYYLESAS